MFGVGLFARNCDKSQTRSNVSKKCEKPIFNSIAAVFFKVETQFAGKCSMPETISVFVPDKMVTDATSTSVASASAADLDFG